MNFTLGTAQLGLDYGIANFSGKPDKNSAFEILNQSVKSGVRYYDTAAAYGNSEEILGEYFASHNSDVFIITKIPPVTESLKSPDNEIEIIANIARYHRKSHPKAKHEEYNKLSVKDQNLVKKLSGILRVADGLDRGHKSLIKNIDINLKNGNLEFILKVDDGVVPELEIWGASRRKQLFEEVYNYKLNFTVA